MREPTVKDDLRLGPIISAQPLAVQQAINPRQILPGGKALDIVAQIKDAMRRLICKQSVVHWWGGGGTGWPKTRLRSWLSAE